MMMSDPKKVAMLILASKEPETFKEAKGPVSDASVAQREAAQSVLSAIEQKDPLMLVDAFKTLIALCEDNFDEDDDFGLGDY